MVAEHMRTSFNARLEGPRCCGGAAHPAAVEGLIMINSLADMMHPLSASHRRMWATALLRCKRGTEGLWRGERAHHVRQAVDRDGAVHGRRRGRAAAAARGLEARFEAGAHELGRAAARAAQQVERAAKELGGVVLLACAAPGGSTASGVAHCAAQSALSPRTAGAALAPDTGWVQTSSGAPSCRMRLTLAAQRMPEHACYASGQRRSPEPERSAAPLLLTTLAA
jgi:hypothetical protein